MGSATRLLLVVTSAALLMTAGETRGSASNHEIGRGNEDVRRVFDTYIKLQADCLSLGKLDAMIASDAEFVGVPRGAGRDRRDLQPSCAAAKGRPARILDLRIRTYGGDTAVLVGELQFPEGGGRVFTSVWVQQKGKWLLASEHSTPTGNHPS
jgi:hypothetical protein